MGFVVDSLKSTMDGKEGNTVGADIMSSFKDRAPIMGGLMGQLFGSPGNSQPEAQAQAPMPNHPAFTPVSEDIIGMNAKPKEGGGMTAILKMLMGGG